MGAKDFKANAGKSGDIDVLEIDIDALEKAVHEAEIAIKPKKYAHTEQGQKDVAIIGHLREQGRAFSFIAKVLNNLGRTSPTGVTWNGGSVLNVWKSK